MSENTNIYNLFSIPDSVDNAIYNLTDAPTKSSGATLGDIWFLVFGGVSQIAEKRRIRYAHELEKYRMELDTSISLIPENKRIEPSIQIAAQALENSKYCVEEPVLRNMFTALISNSMNCDYSQSVHPAYAEIIKQMSVLDAIIIHLFKLQDGNNMPVCNYLRNTKNGAYHILADHIIISDEQAINDNYFESAKSLISLERLGLISVDYSIQIADDSEYDKSLNNPLYEAFKTEYPDNEITIQKGVATLTLFGYSFVCACVPD